MDELIKNLSLLAKAAATYMDAKTAALAAGPVTQPAGPVTQPAAEAKPVGKQTKPAKPEPVEQPTTAEESAEKVTPQAEKVTAEVEVKLVYETDVGPRIKAIGAYKREEVVALLGRYGVKAGKELQPSVYAKFLADLEALNGATQ